MRLVVQRVREAEVSLPEKQDMVTGRINHGLLVLIGVAKNDSKKEADKLVEQLLKLRIMADDDGKMNLSINDTKGSIMAVSQFTLYADTSKGNRPSFVKAAGPQKAERLYDHFVNNLKKSGLKVQTGSFGDYMDISTVLDGPVTIILDS